MQALQFLSDQNNVLAKHLYNVELEPGLVTLCPSNGKIQICTYWEGAFDGYRMITPLETIDDFDIVEGYRFEKGRYGEITAYPPNQMVGLRIDQAILPEWLRTFTCDCSIHSPGSGTDDEDSDDCEWEDKTRRFSSINIFLTTNSETKKTHLIALLPDSGLRSCKIMAYSQKNPI